MSSKRTILVADDDAGDIFLLQRAFSKARISAVISYVRDGEDAIRYLLTAIERGNTPELLLLDLKMPKIGGFEVLEWIRRQPGLKRLLVTVLTSSDAPEDINRAYDIGANSYLVKPSANEKLVEIVGSVCNYWLNINCLPDCDRFTASCGHWSARPAIVR